MRKLILAVFAASSGLALFASADRAKVQAAMDRGVRFLLAHQEKGGYFSDEQMPALTALPLWAMVVSGHGNIEAATNAAKFVVSTQRKDGGFYVPKPGRGGSGLGNYNTSVCMSALWDSRLVSPDVILRARDYIASSQLTGDDTSAGGFGYDKMSRRRYADLSNTSYAMDAMHRTAGAEEFRTGSGKKADIDWEKAIRFVQHLQSTEGSGAGGARYNDETNMAGLETNRTGSVQFKAYGSMSYAAVLSLCSAKLTKGDYRVRSALDFCSKYWTVDENPGMGMQGLYYYFDIVTRALQAAKVMELKAPDGKKIDWRKELSEKITSLQKKDGSWSNSNNRFWESDPVLATSFAIIALANCIE